MFRASVLHARSLARVRALARNRNMAAMTEFWEDEEFTPTTRRQRVQAAALGALVGDAAAMPLHWMYDDNLLRAALGDRVDTPLFFDTPSCPFYSTADFPGHYTTGQASPYGEQARVLTPWGHRWLLSLKEVCGQCGGVLSSDHGHPPPGQVATQSSDY